MDKAVFIVHKYTNASKYFVYLHNALALHNSENLKEKQIYAPQSDQTLLQQMRI
jgi:hypothetical protein